MRILVIGGYARSLVNFRGHLLGSMVDAGHEVHAAAPGLLADQATAGKLASMNVRLHDVAISRAGLNPVHDLKAFAQMVRLMRRIGPHAVLGYTAKPVIWGMLSAALAGVPRRFALITGLGYAFAERASGKQALVGKVARALYRVALKRASVVLFQNRDDAQLFAEMRLLGPSSRVVIVPGSGVDVNFFGRQPLPDGPITFLLIARLLGAKGIREYFEAAAIVHARHRGVRFHLVGPIDESPDGLTAAELEDLLKSGTVEWLGEAADVRPFIANCHVYVLPSYREGTPRTVLEAMAIGRAVITTDAPGCRETVEEGGNGFLVPPRSARALAAAMLRFVETPSLAQTMGAESRRLAERKYDVGLVNRQMLQAMDMS